MEFTNFWQFIQLDANVLFTVSAYFLCFMLVIEIIDWIFTGGAISSLADGLFDFDFNADIDAADTGGDFDADSSGGSSVTSTMFSWFHLGAMPLMILIVIWCLVFALTGWGVQYLYWLFAGKLMPIIPATAIAFVIALPLFSFIGHPVKRLIPKDETSVVKLEDLIGCIGTVELATARIGTPMRCRARSGTEMINVYVQPEPGEPGIPKGSKVRLKRILDPDRKLFEASLSQEEVA